MTTDELRELAQSAIDNRAFGWYETAHRLHDVVSTATAELDARDREIARLHDSIEMLESLPGNEVAADIRRRYREAVKLLRIVDGIKTDDDLDRWDDKRIAFLAKE